MRSLPTLALTASIGVVGLALAPAASAASPDDSVAYLAAELEAGGDRLTGSGGGQTFDDLGLTIDAVLGMTAAGTGGDASAAAADYLVANVTAYTGAGDEIYASATGKMLTFTGARGLNPKDVNGVDLVAQLQGLEQANGQFTDQSEYGDFSNTLGQSFGLIGLKRAGVNPSTESVESLLSQQCSDGGFVLDYPDEGEEGVECVSDPDATSLAVQALDAVGGHDTEVQSAATFLEDNQDGAGGVGGGTSTEASNANSTGLASVAFGLAGRDAARSKALGYLESLTLGCETPQVAGGIAYDQASFDAMGADSESDAITTRATAQALIGVTGTSYAAVTNEGQAAATPVIDCDSASTPTDPEPGTSEPTDEAEQPGDDGQSDDASAPVRPGVVQTDGGSAAGSSTPMLLGGAGLGVLAAGVILVARRRLAEQRH